MPASIRIIKIVKDRNPVTGENEELYTAEIECESEEAKDLAKELLMCPYGQEIVDLLQRANFIPEVKPLSKEELKAQAEEEEVERLEMEEKLREEGRKEVREKYLAYIKKKRKPEDEEAEKNPVVDIGYPGTGFSIHG